jgi:hypothetical protein
MSVREELELMVNDMNPDALFMDDLDDAIIGVGCQYTGTPLVVYSATKIINSLMAGDDGMDYETAHEWYGHNIACAYMGEGTPIIVEDWVIEENK